MQSEVVGKSVFILCFSAAVIIGIFIAGYLGLNGNPFRIHAMENKVEDYLLNERGYSESEIHYLEGNYDPFKGFSYYVSVVFENESTHIYYYRISQDEVYQFTFSCSQLCPPPKHAEKYLLDD